MICILTYSHQICTTAVDLRYGGHQQDEKQNTVMSGPYRVACTPTQSLRCRVERLVLTNFRLEKIVDTRFYRVGRILQEAIVVDGSNAIGYRNDCFGITKKPTEVAKNEHSQSPIGEREPPWERY